MLQAPSHSPQPQPRPNSRPTTGFSLQCTSTTHLDLSSSPLELESSLLLEDTGSLRLESSELGACPPESPASTPSNPLPLGAPAAPPSPPVTMSRPQQSTHASLAANCYPYLTTQSCPRTDGWAMLGREGSGRSCVAVPVGSLRGEKMIGVGGEGGGGFGTFAHSNDDKPYSQRAAAKERGEVEIKDLRRLGCAGRGDVVLGEGHRWRQREQRRKHRATSSLTNHMVPQYNSRTRLSDESEYSSDTHSRPAQSSASCAALHLEQRLRPLPRTGRYGPRMSVQLGQSASTLLRCPESRPGMPQCLPQ